MYFTFTHRNISGAIKNYKIKENQHNEIFT